MEFITIFIYNFIFSSMVLMVLFSVQQHHLILVIDLDQKKIVPWLVICQIHQGITSKNYKSRKEATPYKPIERTREIFNTP